MSLPLSPKIVSRPKPPQIVSLPPTPWMTFGPRPPTIVSGALVPTILRSLEAIVACRPPQRGRTASSEVAKASPMQRAAARIVPNRRYRDDPGPFAVRSMSFGRGFMFRR
ncbi:MAG TPA: hypothetical protein VF729_00980 [Solirubrobacterales bacterium]